MTEAVQFLISLSQALSAIGLYGDVHPATLRAVDQLHDRLSDLQSRSGAPRFTFLRDEVLFQQEVLHDFEGWDWNRRLAEAGIERLEFSGPVDSDQLGRFLDHVGARLGLRPSITADVWQMGSCAIRYGQVSLRTEGRAEAAAVAEAPLPIARVAYSLTEERETVDYLHREVGAGGLLPLVEADAVVRSLSLAMHADRAMVLPLLELKEFDQYTTTHSMNVSVLAMALGEYLELGAGTVRALGLAGLLHDLGKVKIPHDILSKPGRLTPEERMVVEAHPVEGARMLLTGRDSMDFAAVVAYEHHLMLDGGGYPRLRYARGAQYASRLVHVCDVYDALRTKRPYRDAWESARALDYIRERSGIEFDPSIAASFVAMMQRWETGTIIVNA